MVNNFKEKVISEVEAQIDTNVWNRYSNGHNNFLLRNLTVSWSGCVRGYIQSNHGNQVSLIWMWMKATTLTKYSRNLLSVLPVKMHVTCNRWNKYVKFAMRVNLNIMSIIAFHMFILAGKIFSVRGFRSMLESCDHLPIRACTDSLCPKSHHPGFHFSLGFLPSSQKKTQKM